MNDYHELLKRLDKRANEIGYNHTDFDKLVDAALAIRRLRQRAEAAEQRLAIAKKVLLDYCGPSDEPLLEAIRRAFDE